MKFLIIPLAAMLLLSACEPAFSDHNISLIAPAVKNYQPDVLDRAADEIDDGKCPTLGNVMMPDYKVCRDQSRAIK